MDNQEWKMEQQVWQRVCASREEAPGKDLRQLQREAMELAAVYRMLTSQMTGKQREQIIKLYRGEQANVAGLVGIRRLARQNGEQLKLWQPGKEDPRKLLEQCYHRTRRCMTEYLARSAEPEFGTVFERMAKRAGENCALIVEVLGSL